MARLFITPREVDFISDLTKEINKDVIGQKIFYYKIREDLTNVHKVYEEAVDKEKEEQEMVEKDKLIKS